MEFWDTTPLPLKVVGISTHLFGQATSLAIGDPIV